MRRCFALGNIFLSHLYIYGPIIVFFTIKDKPLGKKNLLKIYSVDRQGDLLLATILLDKFNDTWTNLFSQQKFSVFDGEQKLFLLVKHIKEDDENGYYLVDIKYRESLLEETTLFWHEYSSIMQSVWLK